MTEKRENNNFYDNVPSGHVMSRPSLFKTLETVKEQVDYQYFAAEIGKGTGKYYIDPIYNELCLIIAEVYVKPPDAIMRIRGGGIEAGIVQEVYGKLTNEHIRHVAEKFKEQTHLIHKKTPYLQTALYNVLFEYDASITNDLRHAGII